MNILNPASAVLKNYFGNRDQNLKLSLSRYLNSHPGINRNEVTRTVYGIIRKEKLIAHIAETYSSRKPARTDKQTRILLFIGIYLICFSGSYPDYAVVNETVSLAPGRTGGFLNAVLRKISREKDAIRAAISAIGDPLVRYSVSGVILDNLARLTDDTDSTLEYLDSEPVFHVRTNRGDAGTDRILSGLKERNIPCRLLEETGSIEIANAGEMVRSVLPGNEFYFQNTGSFAVAAVTASFGGEKILDCCAAPGTKSLTLSQLLPDSEITAADINPDRLKLINPYLEKKNRKNILLAAADILAPPFKNCFNTVLIDAPCTSSGTLRKNPDLKNKIDPERIQINSDRQKAILSAVMNWVRPGTVIIYAVCSFIVNETEQVLSDSLAAPPGKKFEILDPAELLDRYRFQLKRDSFGVFLLPDNRLNNDLFYISAIRKK